MLIIIRGPLASGKTTISELLAKKLNAEVFHLDRTLKANKLDRMPKGAECIPKENFFKADNIILPTIKKLISQNKTVIIDACCSHQEHVDHITAPFKHIIFTLHTSVETCIQRDKHRKVSYGPDAARAVHNLVNRIQAGIQIDNEGAPEAALGIILKHLNE